MNVLDQEIVLALQEGNQAAADALKKRVYYEFWQTPEGEALSRSADRDAALDRLLIVFEDRYADAPVYPGVLFIHRLVDCATDLLRTEIHESAPEPEIEAPVQMSDEEEIEALAQQFRDDINDPNVTAAAIRQRRDSSVKHRKAWILANTPDFVPTSQVLPNSEVKSFAHLLNDEIQQRGVPKPRAGFYTITANGKAYEYPVAEYLRLSNLAAEFNLIK